MPRPQFSLRALAIGVGFLAISIAALVRPSIFLASGLWTGTVAVLLYSISAALLQRGVARVFWVTFALFGWVHMILVFAPWFDVSTGEFILTRYLLDFLGEKLGHTVAEHGSNVGIWSRLPYGAQFRGFQYLAFLVAGQSSFTILLAYVAGTIARWRIPAKIE